MKRTQLFFACICTGIFLSISGYSQTFTGKAVIWEMKSNTDTSVDIKYGSSGLNIGGYEGTSAIITNRLNDNIYIELKLTLTDVCGEKHERLVKVSVKANSKVGGNSWMGGNEQFDFSSQCKERKVYGSNFKTRISNADFEIVKLVKAGEPGTKTEFKEVTDNVEVTIIKATNSTGKSTAIIRFKNNNKGKTAVVYAIGDEKIVYEPSHLKSGGTITANIGSVQNVNYYVMALLPEESNDPTLLEKFKTRVKEKVTTPPVKNGIKSRKISMTCMCIRG